MTTGVFIADECVLVIKSSVPDNNINIRRGCSLVSNLSPGFSIIISTVKFYIFWETFFTASMKPFRKFERVCTKSTRKFETQPITFVQWINGVCFIERKVASSCIVAIASPVSTTI